MQKTSRSSVENAIMLLLPSIRKMVRVYISNSDDADDVVQEVLIKFFKNYNYLNADPWRTEAWLKRVVRTTACDQFRGKIRLQGKIDYNCCLDLFLFDNDSRHFVQIAAPVKNVEPDMAPRLESALAKLSEKHRQALQMVAEGYSSQEIAKTQGVTRGTARSRVHNARKYARRLLATYIA